MIKSDTLKHLLTRVAHGDRAALEDLYRLTSPRLFGIALRILRKSDLAADVLQSLFVRIHAEADAISRMDDPLAWMVGRAREAALDLCRAAPGGDVILDPFEVGEEVDDPLATTERSPELLALLTCLGHLSQERRRMVLLAYYDGWSREALSIYFDAPPHAVNTWLWRSISELDECLGR